MIKNKIIHSIVYSTSIIETVVADESAAEAVPTALQTLDTGVLAAADACDLSCWLCGFPKEVPNSCKRQRIVFFPIHDVRLFIMECVS